MNTVKAFIEIGNDATYSIYVDLEDNTLNYGIHGTGDTVKEAMEDFEASYEGMKELHRLKGEYFVEASFVYCYDTMSFLRFYMNYFSLEGLSRMTGIQRGQLSNYADGRKKPSKRTLEKIDQSVHQFAKKLSGVPFL